MGRLRVGTLLGWWREQPTPGRETGGRPTSTCGRSHAGRGCVGPAGSAYSPGGVADARPAEWFGRARPEADDGPGAVRRGAVRGGDDRGPRGRGRQAGRGAFDRAAYQRPQRVRRKVADEEPGLDAVQALSPREQRPDAIDRHGQRFP